MQLFSRVFLALGLLAAVPAQAALIDVSGPLSQQSGAAAAIIAAPVGVSDAAYTNTSQEGFNERQGVALDLALVHDGGSIAAGTVVDSHMLFLNSPNGRRENHFDVSWVFSGDILGVMSDSNGANLAASDYLGAPNTTYPGAFGARGLEANDSYTIAGNTLTLSMLVSAPGDWIRVVTASSSTAVPEPGVALLMLMGLIGLGLRRRHAA